MWYYYLASESTDKSGKQNNDAGMFDRWSRETSFCELYAYTGCFKGAGFLKDLELPDALAAWKEHIRSHYPRDSYMLPVKLRCCFRDCPQAEGKHRGIIFEADSESAEDREANFDRRLDHIRDHIVNDRYNELRLVDNDEITVFSCWGAIRDERNKKPSAISAAKFERFINLIRDNIDPRCDLRGREPKLSTGAPDMPWFMLLS